MSLLEIQSIDNLAIPGDIFGGNILFTRDNVDGPSGFPGAAEELGITSVRYPGGSVTENYFDISEPNRTEIYDETIGGIRDLLPISDFMEYAAAEDISVQIVIPTKNFFSEARDSNGDRFVELDEEVLREFVTNALTGEYGDAHVSGFEIGNEYWGSGMSAVEYGRVASEISHIVGETIDGLVGVVPDVEHTDVLVQSGTNFAFSKLNTEYEAYETGAEKFAALQDDYEIEFDEGTLRYSGNVDWIQVNNQLLIREVEEQLADGSINGVVTHVYSRAPDFPDSRTSPLKHINRDWLEEHPDLSVHVSEWNVKANTGALEDGDYALHQAQEMLNMVAGFAEYDVDGGHAWPVINWQESSLSRGYDHEELSVPGEMFALMRASIPGKKLVTFKGEVEENDKDPGLDLAEGSLETLGFANEDSMVLFMASKSGSEEQNIVDLESIISGYENVSARVLGVEEGDDPGGVRSTAVVEELSPDQFMNGSQISVDLGPFEIMQVVIDQPEWTEVAVASMEDSGGAIADPGVVVDPGIPDIPTVDPVPEEPPAAEEEDQLAVVDEDGDGGSMAGLGMLLPLLLLLGLGLG